MKQPVKPKPQPQVLPRPTVVVVRRVREFEQPWGCGGGWRVVRKPLSE